MDKLRSLTVASAIAIALAACAQNETMPEDTTTASTTGSATAGTQQDPAAYPEAGTQQDPAAYPESESSTTASTTTPDASTSGGTMDDGSMSQAGADASATAGMTEGSVSIGLTVQSETGEPIGTVTDVLADATTGAPLYALISTEGETAAVPYEAASSMVQADALVVERSRLESAPRIEQGQLTDPAATWASEANAYWGEGEMRTASPQDAEPVSEGEPQTEQQTEPQY